MTRMNIINGGKGRPMAAAFERILSRANREELRDAVTAMYREQLGVPCGIPWCRHGATHEWIRTAKDLKSMARKYKGQTLTGEPVALRCETHVPSWRVGNYARLVQSAHIERAA